MASFQFANPNLLPPNADQSAREKVQAQIAFDEYQKREKAKEDERTARFAQPPVFGAGGADPALNPTPYNGPGAVSRETTAPQVGVASAAPIFGGEERGAGPSASSSAAPLTQTGQMFNQSFADYQADRQKTGMAGGAMADAMGRVTQAGDAEKSANDEAAAVTQDKSEALEPTYQEQVSLAQKHQDLVQKIQDEARVETDRQMNRVKAAAQQASLLQSKDFWADKTTGARVLGIISQALAGAANGLSGQPGAPTPLDRIIQQDFEMQKQRADEANSKVYQEKSVLDSLHGEVNSKVAAEAAWYMAAGEKVKQTIASVNNMYATPTSKAAADQLNAQIDAKVAKSQQEATTHIYDGTVAEKNDDGRMAASLAGQDNALNIQALKKGANDSKNWSPPGMMESLPRSPMVTAAGKSVNTIVQLNEGLKGALDALQTGGMKKYYEFMAIHANNFALGRTYTGAGANLQGPEEGQVNVFAPDYWKTQRSNLTPEDARMQIEATQRTLMRSLRGQYSVLNKHYTPDYTDPSVGAQMTNLKNFTDKYHRPGA